MYDETLRKDLALRREKLCALLADHSADAAVLTGKTNLAYITGGVIDGYYYIDKDGRYFTLARSGVKEYSGNVFAVCRPEMIPFVLGDLDPPVSMPSRLVLEDDEISAREWLRLCDVFRCDIVRGVSIARQARMTKTPHEIEIIKKDAAKHSRLYGDIPALYKPGMTDLQFSAEIERLFRLNGHIGVTRTAGFRMEDCMGLLLAGSNAAEPSPYDLSLGGAGITPFLPVGVANKRILQGTTVLVDIAGCYSGYVIDMTRVFSAGRLPQRVYDIHNVAIEMENELQAMAKPGVVCGALYEKAQRMTARHGLQGCFMGVKKQAKFVGHGVGLELNELPVLAGRSRQLLEPGMVIAIEPKFITEAGAVGVEDTFLVTESGLEQLTHAPKEIIAL